MARVGILLLLLIGIAIGTSRAASAASIVVDAGTGTVLSAETPNHLWYPASLTKLMTVYVALSEIEAGRLRFEDKIEVSQHAARQAPVRFGLRAGQVITVRDAINATIVASANDAAVALAEKIGETEGAFVTRMTGMAMELGMTRTFFQNASGLPADGQVTTARDLAVLASAFLRDFPQHYELFSQRSVTIGTRSRGTVNSLLGSYEGADGMKTGFTCASGYNLVASAERDGRRLIGIVLGSRNGGARTLEMKRLLDLGFSGSAAPATDLTALADQLTETDGEAPPTVLTGADCAAPQLVGSSLIDSPDELSGWGVALGDYRTRSKAQRALQDAQMKLGAAARGRPAIITRGANGLSRYSVLFAGLEQSSAQQTCKALSAKRSYCVTLSPKILETRFASAR
ncbi:D-alanyl-D-alanine carboxypeptidase family protein [Dongia deserti]|uniref:D-alanyl-D-alanine carboxypeptidase family protein n=1 Tax=Dongia deserti TaxID=2268030 RepID=UPI0013C4BAD8|nr:D-alanyl-D-alanine carboxypeptidase family protein [Dongia deserti]